MFNNIRFFYKMNEKENHIADYVCIYDNKKLAISFLYNGLYFETKRRKEYDLKNFQKVPVEEVPEKVKAFFSRIFKVEILTNIQKEQIALEKRGHNIAKDGIQLYTRTQMMLIENEDHYITPTHFYIDKNEYIEISVSETEIPYLPIRSLYKGTIECEDGNRPYWRVYIPIKASKFATKEIYSRVEDLQKKYEIDEKEERSYAGNCKKVATSLGVPFAVALGLKADEEKIQLFLASIKNAFAKPYNILELSAGRERSKTEMERLGINLCEGDPLKLKAFVIGCLEKQEIIIS